MRVKLARKGTTLHVLDGTGARCGAEVEALGRATRDDIFCGRCLDSAAVEDIPFGEDVGLAIERTYLARLASMPYDQYLRTEHWFRTRQMALDHYGRTCVLCDQGGAEVHHRTYDRRGKERLQDLIVLCRGCHGRYHTEAA